MSKTDQPNVYCRFTEMRPLVSLVEHPRNPNTHPQHQLELLADVIRGNGWRQPITVSDLSGFIIKGHGRYQAAKLAGFTEVPVEVQHYENEAAELADMLADNRIAELSDIDNEVLRQVLADIPDDVMSLTGYTQEDIDAMLDKSNEKEWDEDAKVVGSLTTDFLLPPFTVLDVKAGPWRERKQAWLATGMRSSESRGQYYKGLGDLAAKTNKTVKEWASTSIFDPVLCEIAYAWFSAAGDRILDPFAGGSVRGIVAEKMGREYCGIDLREDQVEANRRQADELCVNPPTWVCGDSNVVLDRIENDAFDMMLSCPPYADLEKYSDDPADISNMEYDDFLRVYRSIIKKTYAKLKDNTFVVWVIGEVRNKKGNYYNFLGDTIAAFRDAGFNYYNEMVLLTPIGTNAITARRCMNISRKPRKVHQNVLVFVKGDGKAAASRLGEVALADFEEDEEVSAIE